MHLQLGLDEQGRGHDGRDHQAEEREKDCLVQFARLLFGDVHDDSLPSGWIFVSLWGGG